MTFRQIADCSAVSAAGGSGYLPGTNTTVALAADFRPL